MIKILFLCHGNICRSPMAEYIFKKLVSEADKENEFEISSAATSREELGNDIYPPAKACLRKHSIPFEKHAAHQVTSTEMEVCDLVVIMDANNARYLNRLFGDKYNAKIHYLMEYAGKPGKDVADPWYTDNFEKTYEDIIMGCEGLLKALSK